MSDTLRDPVKPSIVAILVSLATLVGFFVGAGVWAGQLETRMDNYEAQMARLNTYYEGRLITAETKLDKLNEVISSTNLTLVQMQAQLSTIVRATTDEGRGR